MLFVYMHEDPMEYFTENSFLSLDVKHFFLRLLFVALNALEKTGKSSISFTWIFVRKMEISDLAYMVHSRKQFRS